MEDKTVPTGWTKTEDAAGNEVLIKKTSRPLAGVCTGLLGLAGLTLCARLVTHACADGEGWGLVVLMAMVTLGDLVGSLKFFCGLQRMVVTGCGFCYFSGVGSLGRQMAFPWSDCSSFRVSSEVNVRWSADEPERQGLSDVPDKWHSDRIRPEHVERVFVEVHLKNGKIRRLQLGTLEEAEFFCHYFQNRMSNFRLQAAGKKS